MWAADRKTPGCKFCKSKCGCSYCLTGGSYINKVVEDGDDEELNRVLTASTTEDIKRFADIDDVDVTAVRYNKPNPYAIGRVRSLVGYVVLHKYTSEYKELEQKYTKLEDEYMIDLATLKSTRERFSRLIRTYEKEHQHLMLLAKQLRMISKITTLTYSEFLIPTYISDIINLYVGATVVDTTDIGADDDEPSGHANSDMVTSANIK